MMENLTHLHKTNILIHVTAGSVALITGIVILFAVKGTLFHKKTGRVFLALLAMVIFTGLIGVFIYGRNNFLLIITVLSGYLGYSGYRAVKLRNNQPKLVDIGIAILSLLLVGYFIYYFHSIGMIWAPVIIYSTVGFLIMVITYDLLRYFIPKATYANVWLSEHIWKMISAFTALLSAFCGTVFPQYQPYSQFLPSIFGSLLSIGFVITAYMNRKVKQFT